MNNTLLLLTEGLILFFFSVLGVYGYRHYAIARGFLDVPNARSSHQAPVPRGGGLVFILIWLLGIGVVFSQALIGKEYLLWSLPFTLGFGLLGYWEDTKGLSALQRFIWQAIIAGLFIQVLGGMAFLHLWDEVAFSFGVLGWVMGILIIMWSVNLFNFMDGLDGLAAIESCFVLGGGGLLCWQAGAMELALLTWSMVIAVAGFLVWNWPRALVFMGDVGSYCLGFLVACCAILADLHYQIPITLWGILYGVFWFDATVTLLRRMMLKKNWIAAHRDHAYQRLHQSGWSHRQVLWAVILLNSILALLAFIANTHRESLWFYFLVAVGVLVLAYLWVERLKPLQRDPK